MQHPIQRVLYVPETNTLYTCTGPHIHSFNVCTGELLAEWVAPRAQGQAEKIKSGNGGGGGGTGKKRKSGEAGADTHPGEVLGEGGEEGVGDPNNVGKIMPARSGTHLVVVTNADKSVRVLDRGLRVLSSRTMPKRPCALTSTGDDSTILVADKFGDVYSLPLLEEPSTTTTTTTTTTTSTTTTTETQAQTQSAESKRRRTEILHDLPFTHKLLLGHVSMLTDILSVARPSPGGVGGGGMRCRKYILTADRDEHIRVSRYPQSYVIEGFCLGHRSFVSRLLVPSWDSGQLVSGGGDEFLLRWEWEEGRCAQRVEVAGLIEGVLGGGVRVVAGKGEVGEGEVRPVVVGIWEVPGRRAVIVAFERVPALFEFAWDTDLGLKHLATISLSGNPLDLAVDPAASAFWVSLAPTTPDGPLLAHISLKAGGGGWEDTTEGDGCIRGALEQASKVRFVGDIKTLNEGLLYPTGLLRKGFGKDKDE